MNSLDQLWAKSSIADYWLTGKQGNVTYHARNVLYFILNLIFGKEFSEVCSLCQDI